MIQSPVSENAEKFDGEFDSFLKDLGTLIYRPKHPSDATKHIEHVHHTTVPVKSYRRSQVSIKLSLLVFGVLSTIFKYSIIYNLLLI